MKFGNAFSFLLVLLLLGGCAGNNSHSRYMIFESNLNKTVRDKTRTAKLYDQLDTILVLDVIPNDMELREAWVNQTAAARKLSDADRQKLLTEQEKENGTHAEFYLALYTSDDVWNDLAAKKSRWTVTLENGGSPIRPESIKEIRPEDFIFRDEAPFMLNFRKIYSIRFPRAPIGDKPHNLVISSFLGSITVNPGK